MMIMAAVLAVLTHLHYTTPAVIITLAFLEGAAWASVMPAWQALVPALVPREELPSAIALNSAQFNGARLLGPMLAGVLLSAAGAAIVFDVGHPVADAGDDRSAAPIMELVIDYWPNHYMALYHAGMAEYMLGQRDLATKNLTEFLRLYYENDGWRANGIAVLQRLRSTAPTDLRRPAEPR